jgi:uncharacterized protein YwqG
MKPNNPEDNQLENKDWREYGKRADYYESDAIVYPENVVSIILSGQAEKQREELSKYTAHHLDCDWQEDNECDCGLVNILYPREDLTNNNN